jgi:hypothetical protein
VVESILIAVPSKVHRDRDFLCCVTEEARGLTELIR